MYLILGLGSNLGDRLIYIRDAIQQISLFTKVKKISPVYESDAQLMEGCPPGWNKSFLNIAVLCSSDLEPHQILTKIKKAEEQVGRTEKKEKWAPREIDIDILAMDGIIAHEEGLNIPHEHLLNRPFALWPMADILPDWKYPVKGKNYGKTTIELAQIFGASYPECTNRPGNLFNTIRTSLNIND